MKSQNLTRNYTHYPKGIYYYFKITEYITDEYLQTYTGQKSEKYRRYSAALISVAHKALASSTQHPATTEAKFLA